jgi:hypothetical protein
MLGAPKTNGALRRRLSFLIPMGVSGCYMLRRYWPPTSYSAVVI